MANGKFTVREDEWREALELGHFRKKIDDKWYRIEATEFDPKEVTE